MPSYIVAGVFLLVFTSVKTEILVSDYWIIRKRKWVVPDLFIGGRGLSIGISTASAPESGSLILSLRFRLA
jgi:hypothetical protein